MGKYPIWSLVGLERIFRKITFQDENMRYKIILKKKVMICFYKISIGLGCHFPRPKEKGYKAISTIGSYDFLWQKQKNSLVWESFRVFIQFVQKKMIG